METKEKVIDILNDLIRINNDRIEGYQTAADELKDAFHPEIKAMFFQMAEESRNCKNDLINAVVSLGGKPAKDTTASGKIYRVWMDVKVTFSGNDVKAVLESCEFGEDAAQKAYKDALEEKEAWPADITALISNQRQLLKASHDRIKRYRDTFKEVNIH